MLLFVHISAALLSLLQAAIAITAPSSRTLHVSYGLITATLLSGAGLVYTAHAPVVPACTTGVLYLAVCLGLNYVAHRRLKHAYAASQN